MPIQAMSCVISFEVGKSRNRRNCWSASGGLMETAHLLRSPKNAQRLFTALARAQNEDLPSETVENLRRELDLGETR